MSTDVLGRGTGMWQVDKSDGNKLAAWSFDSPTKGQPDTAVSAVCRGGCSRLRLAQECAEGGVT
ncbi:hypothetical protein ABZ915_34295 [Streptomyces sp. NPDC046915]|uniref:hypothetical protein n=1 Tax=Streptomyces sp. NPDC046915 TaxID=3155257 RepID=UPI00340AD1CD